MVAPGYVESKAGKVKETPEANSSATVATPLVGVHPVTKTLM